MTNTLFRRGTLGLTPFSALPITSKALTDLTISASRFGRQTPKAPSPRQESPSGQQQPQQQPQQPQQQQQSPPSEQSYSSQTPVNSLSSPREPPSPAVPPPAAQSQPQSRSQSQSNMSYSAPPRKTPFFFREENTGLIVKGNFMTLAAKPEHVEKGEWLAHQGVCDIVLRGTCHEEELVWD